MESKLIYAKISEVMNAVEAIGKDRKNVTQGYAFRGIDDMYNALNEHLSKAKIFFTSEIIAKQREERETKSGGNLIYTVLDVRWTIHAEDGSSVSTDTVGEAMDSGDKSANKAMSAAYKYALMQVFCIPTQDPKDTENETHEVKPKATKEFVLSSQPQTLVKKICSDCDKEYSPKPGTENYSKKCLPCFKANGKEPIARAPKEEDPNAEPFPGRTPGM